MNLGIRKSGVFLLLLSVVYVQLLILCPSISAQSFFSHATWQKFLDQYVNEQGEVDYRAAHADPLLLHQYLSEIESLDWVSVKSSWPREERLALLINFYNAGVIKLILEHYPVQSMQAIPGFADLPFAKIGEAGWSLNRVLNHELIGSFRDEKIHMAIACGAKGCPALSQEAFTAPRVEGQLYLAARRFVNDTRYNKIEPGAKSIHLSPVFKWYSNDFKLDFGFSADEDEKLTPEENAILSFVAYYLEDAAKLAYLETRDFKIKYLPFDWSLNQAPESPGDGA